MKSSKRANLLLILCDQLRYDYIGANGCSFIHTPNIDRLAEEGYCFEHAYSPNPVCVAARSNLFSGLPARYHGFDDNYFGKHRKPFPYYLPTLPQILSDSGYETAAVGKMHFQPRRRAMGFDFFYSMEEIPDTREADDYAMFLKEQGYGHIQSLHGVRGCLYMQPQRSLLPERLHGSVWVADRTIEYLERTRARKPFFLCASFIQPHPPFNVPDSWADRYCGKLPPPVRTKTPLPVIGEENKKLACLENDEEVMRVRELYASSVSFMDRQVGRILACLDELNLSESTLVMFASDHGEMLGDLGTYQKFLPYDPSSRIPMILRYPGIVAAGARRRDFVDLNDVMPTFLDAAGVAYPGNYELPGESLLIRGGKKNRTVQYVEHQRESKRWCSLRNQQYKYVHYYGDRDQFFHMEKDPQETDNLLCRKLSKEEYESYQSLRSELISYESRWGLEGCVTGERFSEFPPYRANPGYEVNLPKFYQMIVDKKEADGMMDYRQEVLEAIKKEPIVNLKTNHTAEILRQSKRYREEEIEELIEQAGLQRSAYNQKKVNGRESAK